MVNKQETDKQQGSGGLEGVPGLPGAPQDEASLTRRDLGFSGYGLCPEAGSESRISGLPDPARIRGSSEHTGSQQFPPLWPGPDHLLLDLESPAPLQNELTDPLSSVTAT